MTRGLKGENIVTQLKSSIIFSNVFYLVTLNPFDSFGEERWFVVPKIVVLTNTQGVSEIH